MPPVFFARIHKNGSSLAVVVPREMCRAVPLERGDTVQVVLRRGGLITIRKVDAKEVEDEIEY